ncbi:MBL fold metallo-hydrolase RNA specificity domain-containing protein [Persephonella sp.]
MIDKVTVQSFGGAQTVTGSCHLVTAGKIKILVDCGMFQGLDEDRNYDPFGFDPRDIDYLIVTHAHLDHIGRIPVLVKNGFRGKIISTIPTKAISRIILLDAVKVMEEEHRVEYRKALRRGEPEKVKPPLFDEDDVYEAMEHFKIQLKYHQPLKLTDDIKITFKDAGHILGSAYVQIDIKTSNGEKSLIFSGDLGLKERLIINPLEFSQEGQYIFVESTYGNRKHRSLEETIKEFENAIIESFENGGNIVIPTFALERSQEILYVLREMYDRGKLPNCKVFLDSPLAISATKIFLQFPEFLNDKLKEMIRKGKNPFISPYVKFTQTVEESKMINSIENGAIILAGGGMCTGGRIKHHLKYNLWRPESSVIFVGYQAKGTLGRTIIDGAEKVKIYGEEIAVKAKIYTINGFSSHADKPILLDWLKKFKNKKNIFLIHGEPEVLEIFRDNIKEELKIKPHIVEFGEKIYIN